MQEYLMIAICTDVTPYMKGDVPSVSFGIDHDGFCTDKALFEDNALPIEPGTGPALKAVAATALMGALHAGGATIPFAANDEPSAAERGEFNDAMITSVARIAFNTAREWKKYEGLLHHPPFDEASELQQQIAKKRVQNIFENTRYPLDISNKASVFEDQLYRIVVAAVLAD